jgi:hypothetical protein
MPPWTLTIENDAGERRELSLERDSYILGREGRCDVCLPERNVSRRHARLQRDQEGEWWLVDLGGAYGSFVNGQRVDGRLPVGPYDTMQLGNHCLSLLAKAPAGGPRATWGVQHEPDRLIVLGASGEGGELRLNGTAASICGGSGAGRGGSESDAGDAGGSRAGGSRAGGSRASESSASESSASESSAGGSSESSAGGSSAGEGDGGHGDGSEGASLRLPEGTTPAGTHALVRPLPEGRYELLLQSEAVKMRVRRRHADRVLLEDGDLVRFESPEGDEIATLRFEAARREICSAITPLGVGRALLAGLDADFTPLPRVSNRLAPTSFPELQAIEDELAKQPRWYRETASTLWPHPLGFQPEPPEREDLTLVPTEAFVVPRGLRLTMAARRREKARRWAGAVTLAMLLGGAIGLGRHEDRSPSPPATSTTFASVSGSAAPGTTLASASGSAAPGASATASASGSEVALPGAPPACASAPAGAGSAFRRGDALDADECGVAVDEQAPSR